MKRKIITVCIIIACFILECTIFQKLSFGSITPNLMIIVTSAFGFMRGKKEGMMVGFISGLLIDIMFGDLIGFYTLIYTVLGYANGFFRKIFYDDDIRIEDMDLNQLSENYPNVCSLLYHMTPGADITKPTNIALIEDLYINTGNQYNYTSYNQIEEDDILIVYEEYTCDGKGEVDISVEDPIEPDNFTIDIADSQISIDLETDTNYYVCFSDMDFLEGKDLYYYLDTTDNYTKADLKEDSGYLYSFTYYGGQRPIDQSEIFYIGHPEEE